MCVCLTCAVKGLGDEECVFVAKELETNSTLTTLYLQGEYDMSVYVCYVFG